MKKKQSRCLIPPPDKDASVSGPGNIDTESFGSGKLLSISSRWGMSSSSESSYKSKSSAFSSTLDMPQKKIPRRYIAMLLSETPEGHTGAVFKVRSSLIHAKLDAIQIWEDLEGRCPVGVFYFDELLETWVKVYDTDIALGKTISVDCTIY